MDIFSNIPENRFLFLKNHDFRYLGLRKFLHTRGKTLVQHPGQTIGPTTIKIGMHLSEGTTSGRLFEIFRKFILFSQKPRFS